MIVSHEWLKQFVPHTRSPQEIGDALSRHCVTLDNIEPLGAELASFVVAQVVEAGRHPNSDHLWVTKVDDGSGAVLDVVCGAPNVQAGTKYPFARTGTIMPGGLKIEKRKIRGETSNGMLCSARELGLGQEHDGILALDTDALPGTPLLSVLPIADARLDLDVLPNRPDLLSHLGVAREISAILGLPMSGHPTEMAPAVANVPVHSAPSGAAGALASVRVDDTGSCPRYIAAIISGVQVGPSPEWLRRRLESIGQRSINNVVDATNYVLHGLGQPVHAFDLAKLSGGGIVVRQTSGDESLVTLDGVARAVSPGTTVICDGKRPVALAGVMGGLDSEVTASTTAVLLEVAAFEPRFVRRVRRSVNLSTDASYRFERGVDEGRLLEVARQAAALVAQVSSGHVVEFLDIGSSAAPRGAVTVRPSRLVRVLGVPVSPGEIRQRLESLGCTVIDDAHGLVVSPPTWRHDLLIEVDLIEEVARLIGFDSLPDELRPFRPGTAPDHPLHLAGRRVRDLLVGMGLAETRPMPFTSSGDEHTPRVRNPLADDEPFLRASILDTLSRRAEYNLTRMQGNLRLFEVGSVFLGTPDRLPREEVRVGALLMGSRRPPHFTEPQPPAFDLWDAKELATRLLEAAFPGARAALRPGAHPTLWTLSVDGLGDVGSVVALSLDKPVWATDALGVEITLGVMASADVAAPGANGHDAVSVDRASAPTSGMRFKALPTTPAAEIDLALVVPDGVAAATVETAIRTAGGDLLEEVALFDEFRGPGVPDTHRSLGWRLTFRHPERTLRDKEIEGRRARLLDILDKELGIRPRAS